MISAVPNEYIEQWFLDTYRHDVMEEARLTRILEDLDAKKYDLVFREANLWFLQESMSWADAVDTGCPVERETVQEIRKLLEEK